MYKNGIKYILIFFYYLQLNGVVERVVRVVKEVFVKQVLEGNKSRFIKYRFVDFFLRYCIIFYSIIGVMLVELLMRCCLCMCLSLVKFDLV